MLISWYAPSRHPFSFIQDLQRVTKNHATMKCYGLGLGLDTYRMVALDANFRRLNEEVGQSVCVSVCLCVCLCLSVCLCL
jgi:hypothetical protein